MKKRMKLIAIPILCSLLFSSAEAASVNIENIKIEGADVTVSGTAQDFDGYVTMVVLKKGGSTENSDDILTIAQKKTGETGDFSIYFEVPKTYGTEASDGEYEVIVHLDKSNEDNAKAEFLYISADTRNELLEIIKTKTASEIAAAIADNEIYKKGFMVEGADVERFLALAVDKRTSLLEEVLKGYDKDNMTLSGFAVDFNNMTVFYELNSNKNILDNLKYLKPVFEEKSFLELTDAQQTYLAEMIGHNVPFENHEKFQAGYAEGNILYKLNSARYSDIDSHMDKYKTELELENYSAYKTYLGLSEAKKQSVCESIVKSLEKSKVYTVADYKKVLTDAVNSIPTGSGSSGSSGSSGGSSSSGKSSSASKNTYTQTSIPNGVTAVEADVKEKQPEFNDLDGVEWAKDAILELAEKGIISGRGENKFDPNGIITREEFVKIIVEAAGVHDENAVCDFEDVASGSWYESYVASAVKSGLVNGESDAIFGTGKPITRQDVCVIASKLLKKNAEKTDISFADAEAISEYAKESVEKLVGLGIVSGMGDNQFRPKDTCTRAQAAKIVSGILREE